MIDFGQCTRRSIADRPYASACSAFCLPSNPLCKFISFSDVDECSGDPSPCDQNCENTPPGTYTCSCNDGYKLDKDNKLCIGTLRIIQHVVHYHSHPLPHVYVETKYPDRRIITSTITSLFTRLLIVHCSLQMRVTRDVM